jgi:hypothetical protein
VKGQLDRHHLLPKAVRTPGERQITVKLCRAKRGCNTHYNFHMGNRDSARAIRRVLTSGEVQWMVEQVGSTWVRTIYPPK